MLHSLRINPHDTMPKNPATLAGPRLLSVDCAVGMAERPSTLAQETRRDETPHSLHAQRVGEQQPRCVVMERSEDWSGIDDGGRPWRQTRAASWHLPRPRRPRNLSRDGPGLRTRPLRQGWSYRVGRGQRGIGSRPRAGGGRGRTADDARRQAPWLAMKAGP